MTPSDAKDFVNTRWKELPENMSGKDKCNQVIHELRVHHNFLVFIDQSLPHPIKRAGVNNGEVTYYV